MRQEYSDLQVAVDENPKYAVISETQSTPAYQSEKIFAGATVQDFGPTTDIDHDFEKGKAQLGQRKTICGLAARTFWILVAVIAVIVVAAAIGGGVGGSLAIKHSTSESTTLASSTASHGSSQPLTQNATTTAQQLTQTATTTTTTLQSATTISTSTVAGPSGTLYIDCPSSNNTIYQPSSSTEKFRKICGNSLVNVNNEGAPVTVQVSTLDACIDACAAYNEQYASDIASGAKTICNAACWRSADGDFGGWCYGYQTQNATGTFQIGGDLRCNSAALINQ